jgi:hypothetical protein
MKISLAGDHADHDLSNPALSNLDLSSPDSSDQDSFNHPANTRNARQAGHSNGLQREKYRKIAL